MPSLKDLKNRIASVKSTRKITSAMKMVAASKLRRAQDQAEQARPYTSMITRMLHNCASSVEITSDSSPLLIGNGKDKSVLLVVMTSDRGLCGAFNGSVVRETRRQIVELERAGKIVKLICVGRKGRDLLRREHGEKYLFAMEATAKKRLDITDAQELAQKVLAYYGEGAFDIAHIVYNKFRSAISQVTTVQQVVPFLTAAMTAKIKGEAATHAACDLFEPKEQALMVRLLERNLVTQFFAAMLESGAGEQGARMTAMDNATRNAGDMIDRLTLNYNRSRQAYITKELIEIISGAEAV